MKKDSIHMGNRSIAFLWIILFLISFGCFLKPSNHSRYVLFKYSDCILKGNELEKTIFLFDSISLRKMNFLRSKGEYFILNFSRQSSNGVPRHSDGCGGGLLLVHSVNNSNCSITDTCLFDIQRFVRLPFKSCDEITELENILIGKFRKVFFDDKHLLIKDSVGRAVEFFKTP